MRIVPKRTLTHYFDYSYSGLIPNECAFSTLAVYDILSKQKQYINLDINFFDFVLIIFLVPTIAPTKQACNNGMCCFNKHKVTL